MKQFLLVQILPPTLTALPNVSTGLFSFVSGMRLTAVIIQFPCGPITPDNPIVCLHLKAIDRLFQEGTPRQIEPLAGVECRHDIIGVTIPYHSDQDAPLGKQPTETLFGFIHKPAVSRQPPDFFNDVMNGSAISIRYRSEFNTADIIMRTPITSVIARRQMRHIKTEKRTSQISQSFGAVRDRIPIPSGRHSPVIHFGRIGEMTDRMRSEFALVEKYDDIGLILFFIRTNSGAW
jgi:hypothetical protein